MLLDTEGVDAYDQVCVEKKGNPHVNPCCIHPSTLLLYIMHLAAQTGQYSTQIFSLAILLSSLFVYNQMGPVDESSLDRLSLVTQMTKKIRVRANEGTVFGLLQTQGHRVYPGTASEDELSSFTPAFLWLLRDFYLRLEAEDGRKVPLLHPHTVFVLCLLLIYY